MAVELPGRIVHDGLRRRCSPGVPDPRSAGGKRIRRSGCIGLRYGRTGKHGNGTAGNSAADSGLRTPASRCRTVGRCSPAGLGIRSDPV